MNPYTLLGLDHSANSKSIRAAYRRLSKTHHPDKGGDPAVFAQLKLAHDILLDPDRRARFDATGDVSEKTPDNSVAEALAWISTAMDRIATRHVAHVERIDFISLLREDLRAQLRGQQQERTNAASTKAIWTLAMTRFKVKENSPNYLADVCRGKITSLEHHLAQIEKCEQSLTLALKLLDDSSYDREKAPPIQSPLSATSSIFSNFASARTGNF